MEARIQATNTHFIVVGRDPETMLNFGATAKARSSIGNLLWHCQGAHLEVAVAPIRLRVGCVGTLFGSSERSPRTMSRITRKSTAPPAPNKYTCLMELCKQDDLKKIYFV